MSDTKLTVADVQEIQKRAEAATEGPWQVWNGPAYCGGGKDLCIGSGENWVVNMDHRWGPNYQERVDHNDDARCEKYDCPICQFSEAVTEEQGQTAEFIAHARTDVPRLCAQLIQRERDVADLVEALAEILDWCTEDGGLPMQMFGSGNAMLQRLREGG